MTAFLPVPQDDDPETPDAVVESARTEAAPLVPLPPKPRAPRKTPARAPKTVADPADGVARAPRAPRKPRPKTPSAAATSAKPRAKAAPRSRPSASADPAERAAPAAEIGNEPIVDPGPPPPLPPDVVGSAGPEKDDIVVPPKPPLPVLTAEDSALVVDETSDDVVPDAVIADSADEATDVAPDADVVPDAAMDADGGRDAVESPDPAEGRQTEPDEPRAEESADADPVEAEEIVVTDAAAVADADAVLDDAAVLDADAAVLDDAVPAVEDVAASAAGADASEDEALRLEEIAAELAPSATAGGTPALALRGVSKTFGSTRAVDGLDLTVPVGSFYGLVGPNGAGKTTTLSMIAGLLRPDRGSIEVAGLDVVARPAEAKRLLGVLPDRLRTFDRLTGRQLLYYYGVLRRLAPAVVASRSADLARAFDLTDSLGRVVSDYSAGMVKKIMLAGAMIHSPRVLVLDEPFESVDPVSSATILDILSAYVAHGGTVILSSHGMELVERVCTRVAVLVSGQVLAEGTVDEVRGELTLEQRFIELAGGTGDAEGLEWLHTFSD